MQSHTHTHKYSTPIETDAGSDIDFTATHTHTLNTNHTPADAHHTLTHRIASDPFPLANWLIFGVDADLVQLADRPKQAFSSHFRRYATERANHNGKMA